MSLPNSTPEETPLLIGGPGIFLSRHPNNRLATPMYGISSTTEIVPDRTVLHSSSASDGQASSFTTGGLFSYRSASVALLRNLDLKAAFLKIESHQEEDVNDAVTSLQSANQSRRPKNSIAKLKTRLPYYLPIIQWVRSYNRRYLLGDILAGISVASMLIPSSLALSDLARVPVNHGLYCAFFSTLTYAFLGTSPQMAVGPEAVVAILTGMQIAPYEGEAKLIAAATITFMVGIITIALGLLRVGFIDSILSRALLRGFIIAVAFHIMAEQVPGLLGYTSHSKAGDTAIEHIVHIWTHRREMNWVSALFGCSSLFVLLTFNIIKKRVPSIASVPMILFVVVISTMVSKWIDAYEKYGVKIIGEVESGFVTPASVETNIDTINHLLPGAVLIFLCGFVESIAIGKAYANKHSYRLSPNRELVALGASNIVSAIFGGYPCFGSLARSKVMDQAGSRTQAAGAITAGAVFVMIMWALPTVHFLPKPVMAGIIIVAASNLIELDDIGVIIRIHKFSDVAMFVFTFSCTMVLGLISGISISSCISLLLVVEHTTIPRISIIGRVTDPSTGKFKYKNAAEFPEATSMLDTSGIMIIGLEQSLYFANMGQMKDNLRRIEKLGSLHAHPSEAPKDEDDSPRKVIFDLYGVPDLDASAMQIMVEIVKQYHSRGIVVCFTRLRETASGIFYKSGLVDIVGEDHMFDKIGDAVEFLESVGVSPDIMSGNSSVHITFDDDFSKASTTLRPESSMSRRNESTRTLEGSSTMNSQQLPID
eukprot:CFRG3297T1